MSREKMDKGLWELVERVEHLNLVLRAIRNVNQLIVREKDRDKLLKGACDNLVETRGYYNAWIALLDESGKLVAHAESKMGKSFLPMVERLKRGQLTVCGQRALKQTETAVTEDPVSTCTDCPLSGSYAGRSATTTRLEYEGKIYGLLSVSVPREVATDVEELGLFHELATDIAFALYNIELEAKHKEMEEELRKSNEMYRTLMDNSLDGIWFSVYEEPIDITLPEAEIIRLMVERDVIVAANDMIASIEGFDTGSQLIGKHWSEVDSVEYQLQITMAMVRNHYKIDRHAFASKDPEGNIRYFEESEIGNIVDGKLVNAFGIARDITERKEAEEALRKSNEMYQTLMDNSLDAIWFSVYEEPIDITLPEAEIIRLKIEREIIVEANDVLASIEGFDTGSQLIGKHWAEVDSAEHNLQIAMDMVRNNYKVDKYIYTVKDSEGIRYFEESEVGNIVDGKLVSSFGIARDITQRKKVEEALRKSNEMYQSLMDNSVDGIWFSVYEEPIDITLPEAEIVRLQIERETVAEANDVVARMHGLDKGSQLIGKNWAEVSSEEYNLEAATEMVRNNYKIDRHVYIDKDLEGNIRYLEESDIGNIVDGKLVSSFGIVRDITQRKKAEEELRKSNEMYRALMDNSLDGIWFSVYEEPIDITLPEAEIIRLKIERETVAEANDVLARIEGLDKGSQLIGKNWAEVSSEEYNLEAATEMVRNNYKVDRHVFRYKDSEGIRYFEESEVGNIVDGKLVSSFGIARDITQRKKMEEEKKELEQKSQLASRLATVGEMASGVAHEINNPLTGVIGFSQLLAQREDIPEDTKQQLEIIAEGSQRVASIVSRLLAFARQHKPEQSYIDINELLENTLKLRAYEIRTSDIELSTRLDSALPRTMADGAQLQQVFLNIIINAETEMKEVHGKGKLVVKTEAIDDTIRISFKDNGPGISPENLDRLFDPFFTTREVGKGTGLGLSICHGIITEHNGKIYARSNSGKGATFVVELPVVAEVKQAEPGKPAIKEVKKVIVAKILVVDDEPTTLQLLTHLLSSEGYDVESTEDAATALEKIKSQRYNLILLDIKLPGMSGIELYESIQKVARSLASRVVFITGDAMAPDTMSFLSRTKAPHITKPFDIKKLKRTVRRILAQS